MAGFYSARGRTIPPLPWPTFAPPLSTEALSGGIQKWNVEPNKRLLDVPAGERAPGPGLYRIITDAGDGQTWLATPDYRPLFQFKKPAVDPKPSLFSGRIPGRTTLVDVLRIGRGKMRWPRADA